MSAAIVLLAGGSGTRVGAGVNKVLLPLGAGTVLGRAVTTALEVPDVARIVLVVRAGEESAVSAAVAPLLGEREIAVVTGGTSRHGSEWQAIQVLATDIERGIVDVVAIHDAARPLATIDLYTATIEAAREHGGAIPVAPLPHLLTSGLARVTVATVGVQTPQSFRAPDLLAAYRRAAEDGAEFTDTAGCLEQYGTVRIAAVPSTRLNLKVTFPEDVAVAAALD